MTYLLLGIKLKTKNNQTSLFPIVIRAMEREGRDKEKVKYRVFYLVTLLLVN